MARLVVQAPPESAVGKTLIDHYPHAFGRRRLRVVALETEDQLDHFTRLHARDDFARGFVEGVWVFGGNGVCIDEGPAGHESVSRGCHLGFGTHLTSRGTFFALLPPVTSFTSLAGQRPSSTNTISPGAALGHLLGHVCRGVRRRQPCQRGKREKTDGFHGGILSGHSDKVDLIRTGCSATASRIGQPLHHSIELAHGVRRIDDRAVFKSHVF